MQANGGDLKTAFRKSKLPASLVYKSSCEYFSRPLLSQQARRPFSLLTAILCTPHKQHMPMTGTAHLTLLGALPDILEGQARSDEVPGIAGLHALDALCDDSEISSVMIHVCWCTLYSSAGMMWVNGADPLT